MSSTWSGTLTLLAAETGIARAECYSPSVGNVHLRLTFTHPDITINCYRTDGKFVCETPANDALLSSTEVLHVVESGQRFSVVIGFMAIEDGVTDLTIEVISGDGDIQNASLTAEAL